MARAKKTRRGNATLEFTLVGIPLIFVLISTFEMARGMWLYHTLAFAVKEGSRYAAVKGRGYVDNTGADCASPPYTNCPTVAAIAARVRDMGVGLDPAEMSVTFTAGSGGATTSHSCPDKSRLSDCLNDTAQWPPAAMNVPGMEVGVSATYPFRSAIAMFWPGADVVGPFPTFHLPANAVEEIQF